MGRILNGKYNKDSNNRSVSNQSETYKSWHHQEQRNNHAKDIIQPYNRDGTPNQAFVQAWPEESKRYGFLPSDDDLRRL